MAEPMLDQAAKLRVQEALLERARADLAAARKNVAGHQSAARLDQDASHEIDDQWQADDQGDLAGLFERQRATTRAALEQIESLDFALTDLVGPGAIVSVDGQRYVVGVVGEPVEVDGVSYQTMSADSPLSLAIRGSRAGATVTFRGREQRIDFVA